MDFDTLNDLAERRLAEEDFGWRKLYQPVLPTQPLHTVAVDVRVPSLVSWVQAMRL